MGSVWGVNTSTARVHALLMASDESLSLDDIASRLQISRGNASMCLKDLRNWGVVRLAKVPGDRRDYYVSEPDVWKMSFAIARERKRRPYAPTR
jgi:DNA-binding transcriptional regulator GbsR (MarR family)